jgi:hypothetical protein
MTAPRTRLIEAETDFERDLLRSWGHERPSDRARQRARGLFGVGTALGVSAASTATAASQVAGGAGAATGSMAPKAVTLGALTLGKWLAAGAVVVAAAGVTVEYARSPSSAAAPSGAPIAAPVPRSPSPPNPVHVSPAASDFSRSVDPYMSSPAPPVPAMTVPQPASAREPAHAQEVSRPRAVMPAPGPSDDERPTLGLGEQVAALDRARNALASGDTTRGIRLLDEYQARFPKGILAQEATVLRIEALLAGGNRPAAADIASQFLASNPTSPHAARIRRLLQRGSNL